MYRTSQQSKMSSSRCAALFFALAAAAPPPPPPPMAPAFTVNFTETFSGYPAPPTTGAWYYDWPRRLWRADHNAPQNNNFCSCANNATTAACSLLFVPVAPGHPDGGLFAEFPDAPGDCCRLCGPAEGCTPLMPTWLSASARKTYAGLDARGCGTWCEPGDEAAADCMSFGAKSRGACLYTETFRFGQTAVVHNLTFDLSTYVEAAPPAALFAVRPACSKPCPRLFPATCG